MDRTFYLELAKQSYRFPIGADIILNEQPDPESCRMNGKCLGGVLVEAARRFNMPLVFPLMDLRVEKEWMLTALGIAPEAMDTFHFQDELEDGQRSVLETAAECPPTPRMVASLEAIQHVADEGERIPMGMSIGPFSLLTKLLDDPIAKIYTVSLDPEDDDAVIVLELLEYITRIICKWISLQCEAGARAVCVCEPACNTVYLSPNQIEANPGLLDMLVIQYNQRIKATLRAHNADLILHDCGELNDAILRSFNALDPAILSLGSPTHPAKAAALISKNTVLMGNLPSKKFYSDKEMPESEVVRSGRALLSEMKATGHPFILGTECDVLCVKGCEHSIMNKVMALVNI
ncbi:MAG: uroporphyrinogen decarboxylase family protein [Opitutales bacterium]